MFRTDCCRLFDLAGVFQNSDTLGNALHYYHNVQHLKPTNSQSWTFRMRWWPVQYQRSVVLWCIALECRAKHQAPLLAHPAWTSQRWHHFACLPTGTSTQYKSMPTKLIFHWLKSKNTKYNRITYSTIVIAGPIELQVWLALQYLHAWTYWKGPECQTALFLLEPLEWYPLWRPWHRKMHC